LDAARTLRPCLGGLRRA